jgi:hypothetical protein
MPPAGKPWTRAQQRTRNRLLLAMALAAALVGGTCLALLYR